MRARCCISVEKHGQGVVTCPFTRNPACQAATVSSWPHAPASRTCRQAYLSVLRVQHPD
ncbi:hypothetical protein BCR44DRAFT_1435152 [Catenaria anguillulae PL171]|uniref:Uncharacterized protein n=1 Tax=Catenaria anguillulae PL171 TaxID=765915 RepID=A0A1Y2HKJ9_9FUNG|nr:hypothetical protein BCR44DRAFT_1435152 [Catenaria anguillulae PL171]